MNNKLNIQSVFDSIDGEANGFDGAGQLCTFIRLKGCNFHPGCSYCDTRYAQESEPANLMTIDEIMKQVHFPKVTVTGGEPAFQRIGLKKLVYKLIEKRYLVTIETNGSIDISDMFYEEEKFLGVKLPAHTRLDHFMFRFVVDYKLPSSGVEHCMNLNLFEKLRDIDVIKFVISDEKDYKRACELIEKNPNWIAKMVFSPMMELVERNYWGATGAKLNLTPELNMSWPRQLVEMMIRDKIPAQFSLQLHKLLWPGAKEER